MYLRHVNYILSSPLTIVQMGSQPNWLYALLVAFCFFWASGSSADELMSGNALSQKPTQLNSQLKLNLGPVMSYIEGHPEDLTPDALADRLAKSNHPIQWQSIQGATANLGFKTNPYWFKVSLETQDIQYRQWILEQTYPLIDQLDVFLYEKGKLLQEWHVGDQLPFRERALQHAHFLFPMVLTANTDYEIYIRVRNSEAMELTPILWEQSEFYLHDNQRSVIDGIFYGLLLIMAAYNLVLFLNIRDISYFYYVCYVMSMLLFFMGQKGVLFQYFMADATSAHHYAIPFSLIVTLISVALFFKEFLNLPVKLPKVWSFIKGILILQIATVISVFSLPYHISIFIIMFIAAFAAFIALCSATYLSYQGERTAQMLLTGWFLLIICIIFMVLSKLGVIYHEFMANYGLRLGTSFEIVIFSFALSYRINQERHQKEMALEQVDSERIERIRAQDSALKHEIAAREAKEEALQKQKELNENLEMLVTERTKELERTLTFLEKANKELEDLSSKDGLTGVYNRRIFDERSQLEWKRCQREQIPLTLILVDIDHFKKVNDHRGHQCGDHVLRELGTIMKTLINRPADCAARYGGEEFAILLPNTPAEGGNYIAQKLVQLCETHPITWSGETFQFTISAGVNTATPATTTSHSLERFISDTDKALYSAKHNGRNQHQMVIN